MIAANVLTRLTDKCDIYFEGSLISKEIIVQKYADFFMSAFCESERSVSIALHTGSVCFDVISLIAAAFGCIALDKTDSETIIASLNDGDMVLYSNERYRWRGIDSCNGTSDTHRTTICDGVSRMFLEQDGKGNNGKSKLLLPYESNKHLIRPYYGTSDITDGRGIRSSKRNRLDFISHILDITPFEVSSVTGVSTVVLAAWDVFKRIADGLEIRYGKDNSIGLLDIVTASYYTDSGEEYQYGSNPAKTDPVLKITGKISTARDLVLNKRGNVTVGLLVIGSGASLKGSSELEDLLSRKTLRFAHVATDIDSEYGKKLVEAQDRATVFATTKKFLLHNFLPSKENNILTTELNRQIENIINNNVIDVIVEGGYTWDDLRSIKELLYIIKNSAWDEEPKRGFVILAYSLLNLFVTACFPIERMEKAVREGRLVNGVTSPKARIDELKKLANATISMSKYCSDVVYYLEIMACIFETSCPKYDELLQRIAISPGRKILVIVPKSYYVDILNADERFSRSGAVAVTANRFDTTSCYDEIIVVGDFIGKNFDPLKCGAASNITVLLYSGEKHIFRQRKRKISEFEKILNFRVGVASDKNIDDQLSDITSDELDVADANQADLEAYVATITFDIGRSAARYSSPSGNGQTSEIVAVGRFTGGEQIFFSKYYNALVFDSVTGEITETAVDTLTPGDVLLFAKRDDNTKDMVDYVYDSLQASGRLDAAVLDATEKAGYWKGILKEFKEKNNLSYRDISKLLATLGSSLQEVTIRQWMIPESHIVGPRDEKTLEQIAALTQDAYLLRNPHGYFEACRTVRRQRKKILGLIGKAITDSLSGRIPPKDSEFEVVYGSVELLSKTLELDVITQLEESVIVPINIINKPLMNLEVPV